MQDNDFIITKKIFVGHLPFKKVAGLNARAAPLEIPTWEALVGPRTPAPLFRTHPITHHLKLACWQQHDTLINIPVAKCRLCSTWGFYSAPSRLFCTQSLSCVALVTGRWAVRNYWYSPHQPEQNPKPQFQLNPQQSIFFIWLSMSFIRWVTPTSPGVSPGAGLSPLSTAEQSMPVGEWSLMKSPV